MSTEKGTNGEAVPECHELAHLPFVQAFSELPKLKDVPWMHENTLWFGLHTCCVSCIVF